MTELRVAPAASGVAALTDSHTLPADAVARHLGVDVETGLGGALAAERLASHGPNKLPEPLPRPVWKRVLDQFRAGLSVKAATRVGWSMPR